MRCFGMSRPNNLATVVLMFVGLCTAHGLAQAEDKPKAEVAIQLLSDGPSPFVMRGIAPHFGRFACYGEIEFQPGMTEGTLDGEGVAVLVAANGDQIVGVVSCQLNANGLGQIHFSWRDSVEFSDGTIVSNTGRFQKHRPSGVVIAIIAILLG